jgi:hypothetical protein
VNRAKLAALRTHAWLYAPRPRKGHSWACTRRLRNGVVWRVFVWRGWMPSPSLALTCGGVCRGEG